MEKAKDYIRAGDIFQVVPAQRWTQDFPLPPFALYRSLRRTNPSPVYVLFQFRWVQVSGASPKSLCVCLGMKSPLLHRGHPSPWQNPRRGFGTRTGPIGRQKELAEHYMLLVGAQ